MRREITDSYITHAFTKLNGRFGALPAAFVEDEDSAALGMQLLDDGAYPRLTSTVLADALLNRTLAEQRAVKRPVIDQPIREAAD